MIASVAMIREKQQKLSGLFLGLVFVFLPDLLLAHSPDLIAVARHFGRDEALGYAEGSGASRMRMKWALDFHHWKSQSL